jgi:hypothetical protein
MIRAEIEANNAKVTQLANEQFEYAPAKLNESPVWGSRALLDHAACAIKA